MTGFGDGGKLAEEMEYYLRQLIDVNFQVILNISLLDLFPKTKG